MDSDNEKSIKYIKPEEEKLIKIIIDDFMESAILRISNGNLFAFQIEPDGQLSN